MGMTSFLWMIDFNKKKGKHNMKVITFDDITKMNIDPVSCYEWVCEMIKNKRNTILPAKISLSSRDGMFMNTMPCILNENFGGKGC